MFSSASWRSGWGGQGLRRWRRDLCTWQLYTPRSSPIWTYGRGGTVMGYARSWCSPESSRPRLSEADVVIPTTAAQGWSQWCSGTSGASLVPSRSQSFSTRYPGGQETGTPAVRHRAFDYRVAGATVYVYSCKCRLPQSRSNRLVLVGSPASPVSSIPLLSSTPCRGDDIDSASRIIRAFD